MQLHRIPGACTVTTASGTSGGGHRDSLAASKKTICACDKIHRQWYDTRDKIVRDLDAFGTAVYLEFKIRRVNCTRCQAVKTETISWLAFTKRATKRFEEAVGKMARDMPLTKVAEYHRIGWNQAWRMELEYMRELSKQHPPALNIRVIGVDEISGRRGPT